MSSLTNSNFLRRSPGRSAKLQSHLTSQSMHAINHETSTTPLPVHNESDTCTLIKNEVPDSQMLSEALHHNLGKTTEFYLANTDQHLDEYNEDFVTVPYAVQPQALFLYGSHTLDKFEGNPRPEVILGVPQIARFPTSHPVTDYLSDSTIHEQNLTPFSSNSSDYFADVNQDFGFSDDSWSEWAEKTSPVSASQHEIPRFEGDDSYDKPYARLIWEALMQAPDHRMMLREIYDWFVQNTNKPRESGTNGWQNSIRHNLSMNQAFENDKSDPLSARGSKKANSVWMLTDHAIKHGVQSTTRFRKQNLGKKTATNQSPAVQRQKSGAKGGRAARRAARLKKHEETQNVDWPYEQSPMPVISKIDYPNFTQQSYGPPLTSIAGPTTPSEHHIVGIMYSLPSKSLYNYDAETTMKYDTHRTLNEEERQKYCHGHQPALTPRSVKL